MDTEELRVAVYDRIRRGEVPKVRRLSAELSDAGRLKRGYVRREPSAAAEYLQGVGLSGAFWDLPK